MPATEKQLNLGVIQSCSGINQLDNFNAIEPMVRQAIADGAEFISMPEAVNSMSQGRAIEHYSELNDPFVSGMKKLAKEMSLWLHIGSVIVREQDKLYNRTLIINSSGEIQQRYNKIHMFDIELEGKSIRESDSYTAGTEVKLAQCPWGNTGLSICYDVRFPAMYQQLAQLGCRLILVPAAFTYITGKAHWRSLLRARAIENSAWLVAANQCGHHEDGRHTWGHSLIIDPWGKIILEGGEQPQVLMAEINLSQADEVRRQIPAWKLN